MSSRQLNFVFGGVVLVSLGVIGYLFYQNNHGERLDQQVVAPSNSNLQDGGGVSTNDNKTSGNANTAPKTTSTVGGTGGWKTFANDKYGFSIKYPSDWEAGQSGEVIGFVSNETKRLMDANTKNCDDNNPATECMSEFYGQSFAFDPRNPDLSYKEYKGEKVFNGVTFKMYADGGLFGNYTTYTTSKNGAHFTFYTDDGNL